MTTTARSSCLTAYPAAVFFDGLCPLCRREVDVYRKKDTQQNLQFVDIAAIGFDAATWGLDPKKVTEVMHARTADGKIFTGVEAFEVIWRAIPGSFLTRAPLAMLKVPGMRFVAHQLYKVFARNRYRLTGRCTPESCGMDSGKST